MSTSIYLVSSDSIRPTDAIDFLKELNSVDLNIEDISGLVNEGSANVWMYFLGSSVLEESDAEEIDAWLNGLKADAISFFELVIGKGEGSMGLAIEIAKKSMKHWTVVVDDLHERVYTETNVDEMLTR